MPDNSQAEILQSWKEIAAYIGRGVRTLQRYETEMGFPVRRASGRNRSAVLAFKVEVDEWLQRTRQRSFPRNGFEDDGFAASLAKSVERARSNCVAARINREQAVQIRQIARQQREGIQQTRERLQAILARCS